MISLTKTKDSGMPELKPIAGILCESRSHPHTWAATE